MFAASAATKIATNGRLVLTQSIRQMSVVSSPPTVKISHVEKMCHATALLVGMSAIPCWVLVNIKHYRARD